jgi:flagellar hook-length control protein FliK
VRAQVLRTVAARQLDPGALNNLRLAISTRELGQVDVQLNAAGDRLKIEITAAGREAETALRRSSGDLKDAVLARSDRFRQVEVRVDGRTLAESDEGQEENPGRSGRDRQEREDGRNARQGDRDRGSGPEA